MAPSVHFLTMGLLNGDELEEPRCKNDRTFSEGGLYRRYCKNEDKSNVVYRNVVLASLEFCEAIDNIWPIL